MRILFIGISRGVDEHSDVNVARCRHICYNILHASFRHPRVEVLTVTSQAEEIFTNASSNTIFQYCVYFIGSYAYGDHSLR